MWLTVEAIDHLHNPLTRRGEKNIYLQIAVENVLINGELEILGKVL